MARGMEREGRRMGFACPILALERVIPVRSSRLDDFLLFHGTDLAFIIQRRNTGVKGRGSVRACSGSRKRERNGKGDFRGRMFLGR